MTINNITRILIFLFVFSVVISCKEPKTTAPAIEEDQREHKEEEDIVEFTSAQSKTAGIELGKIEKKQISGTIKVNGTLDVPPQQLVSISVPLGGFVKNTSLLQGSRVKKGQLIATIENLDFIQIQQDYIEAKSQFELATTDYERQQQLAKENINSQKTLQQAKTNFSTWQAKYSALREKLKVINVDIASVEEGHIKSTINLYSPIGGYVTEVNVNIGKFVTPTDIIFEIVDTEHLHAELIVFEKDVPKLKIGQKVRFTLANETKERMATVYLIGRAISKDRTVQIHCHIDEEDKELLPGMYLSALVEAGGALVTALPNEAIISYQGKTYVFVAVGENEVRQAQEHQGAEEKQGEREYFKMVEIQISSSELGYTEVVAPDTLLSLSVVTKGAYSILSKMKNSEDEHGH
jgi:membrane fusion protein, heavy metal efflux system